ncbi:MAG TPA: hypothetical protein HA345_04935 [Candidatus Thalassarchaeaceae archaeon]|nr:MAG TPA: hypothetical protein D7H94_04930 [Candidatus Poseidoniales archaeon]HIH84735.1 hypothetical protein [Candidatus Thalassarchaeaceae archaeon]
MSSNEGDMKNVLSNLFSNREGTQFALISFIATLILISYTGYDTVVIRTGIISEFADDNEYRITFSTQNETMQEVVTLQDDETRNLLFDLSEIDIPDGYSIGHIDVSVTSEEESGFSGQCDSVAGDIIMNDLAAQWSDPRNNLSGQDSSCIPIELYLAIYPNFNGESITVSAINEYQALQNWSEEGWGEGSLSIDLDLDVNAPLGFDPGGFDSDEEITVDVYITLFKVSIQEIE